MIVPDYTPRNIIHHTFGERGLEETLSPEGRKVLASLTRRSAVPSSSKLELLHVEATSGNYGRAQRLHTELINEFLSHPEEDVRGLAAAVPAAVSCTHHIHERITSAATLGLPLDRVCQYTTPFVKACLQAAFPEAFVVANVLYALSRPPGALESPLSRLLPCYSLASFGFVPAHGHDSGQTGAEELSDSESGDSGEESSESPSPVTPPQTRFFQLPQPEKRRLELVFPEDYDWTGEKFAKLEHEIWRYRDQESESGPESTSEDSASSQTFPSGQRSEDDEEEEEDEEDVVSETELLAQAGADKICVLVVAESGAEITQALVSAVYHRRAWGITTPVLGVIVEPTSPILRFAMAWAEDTACEGARTNPDELPAVHVARAPESAAVEDLLSSDPDLGRFHVGDLRSSLSFAMAVLSQKAMLSLDSVPVHDPGVAERCAWRTDRIPHIPDEDGCEVDLIDYVSSWIDDAAGLAEAPLTTNTGNLMAGKEKRPIKTKDASALQATKALSVSAGSARSSVLSASEQGSTKTKVTALSCSVMARLEVDKATGGPEPTISWLANRHTAVISIPPEYAYKTVPKDKDLAAHLQIVRPHVSMYYAYMSLKADDFVLSVPEHRDGAVVADLKAYLDAIHVHEPTQGVVLSEQAQALSAFLQVHLPDLLSVVSDARGLVRGAEREGDKTVLYSEAEYRKVWDKLLGICLKAQHQGGDDGKPLFDVHYRCEPMIKFPRNEVYDFVRKYTRKQEDLEEVPWHDLTSYTVRLLRSQRRFYRYIAGDSDITCDIQKDMEAVIRTISLASNRLDDDCNADRRAFREAAMDVIITRMRRDPRGAKCDVLGFLCLPHRLSSKSSSQKIFSVPVGPAPRSVEELTAVVDPRDPRLLQALFSDSESNLHLSFCSMRIIANVNRVEDGADALLDLGEAIEDRLAQLALESEEEDPDARDDSDDRGRGMHGNSDHAESEHDDLGAQASEGNDGQGEGRGDNAHGGKEQAKDNPHYLRVPFLAVEYKKADGNQRQCINQLRMYSTSLSKYLAHLGVEDFPTFGLATDGVMGFVTCTFTTNKLRKQVWFDRDAEVYRQYGYTPPITYIMEHNSCGFNITRPGDVINLAVFLYRLSHSYAQELAKRLRKAEESADHIFPMDWAQEAQNPTRNQSKNEPAAKSPLPPILEGGHTGQVTASD